MAQRRDLHPDELSRGLSEQPCESRVGAHDTPIAVEHGLADRRGVEGPAQNDSDCFSARRLASSSANTATLERSTSASNGFST